MDDLEKILVEEYTARTRDGTPYHTIMMCSQYKRDWFDESLEGKLKHFDQRTYYDPKCVRSETFEVTDSAYVFENIGRKIDGNPGNFRYTFCIDLTRYDYPFDKVALMIRQCDAAKGLEHANKRLLYELVREVNELRDRVSQLANKLLD